MLKTGYFTGQYVFFSTLTVMSGFIFSKLGNVNEKLGLPQTVMSKAQKLPFYTAKVHIFRKNRNVQGLKTVLMSMEKRVNVTVLKP